MRSVMIAPSRPKRDAPDSSAQRLYVGGVARRTATEHSGAGHQGIGPGLDTAPGSLRIDAAIHLEVDRLAQRVDRLAQAGDLGELARDEGLASEPRIDAHHQYQVEVAQQRFDEGDRRAWIEHQARALSEAVDQLDGARGVRASF